MPGGEGYSLHCDSKISTARSNWPNPRCDGCGAGSAGLGSASEHYTYQADLLYMIGVTRLWVAEQLGTTSDLLREERRRLLAEAMASLQRALEVGPPYGHPEDRKMSRKDIEERLREWRLELQQI